VFSDSCPFGAAEFKRVADNYEFLHNNSSPYFSQSNGRVENGVKMAKRLMTKASEKELMYF